MIRVKKEGIILKKTNLPFEEMGVLNPAVIQEGDSVHLFYRAVRKGNHSSIGYARMEGPTQVVERMSTPLLIPQFDYEWHGIEDPRIVKIDDIYHLTYTAYDGLNAMGALATSSDRLNFSKRGIIVPKFSYHEIRPLIESHGPLNEKYARFNLHNESITRSGQKKLVWDKNVSFFPRRINGQLYFIHRIKPDIQIVSVKDLDELTPDFWQTYFLQLNKYIVMAPKHAHEVSYIGGGCPPIETLHGWLLIYHSVCDTISGYVYTASAALLNLEHPELEIARLPYPLFEPQEPWEITGEVNNVVFPTGTTLFGDTLFIYYGAADERIACASVSLNALVNELLKHRTA